MAEGEEGEVSTKEQIEKLIAEYRKRIIDEKQNSQPGHYNNGFLYGLQCALDDLEALLRGMDAGGKA